MNSVSARLDSGVIWRVPKRLRKKGWSLTISTTVTAVLSFLATTSTPAVTAYAAQQRGIPAGRDVSYPQCGKTLPSGQAFGIAAVNEGLANTTNPSCPKAKAKRS